MKIDVLEYASLPDFLRDFVRQKKLEKSTWSIAGWARSLGLKSTTSMTMIINAQRNCGKKIEAALIEHFKFSEKEKSHFQYLVEKAKKGVDHPVASLIASELASSSNLKKTIVLSPEQMNAIGSWYFFSIRQLARVTPLKMDESWLRTKLDYQGEASLAQAVDTLLSLGFLESSELGIVARDVILTTDQNVSSEAIKKYHEEMGTLALRAIRKFSVDQRSFQGCTLKIEPAKVGRARQLIEKFMADFEGLIDTTDGQSVYQMNVQFFPLVVTGV